MSHYIWMALDCLPCSIFYSSLAFCCFYHHCFYQSSPRDQELSWFLLCTTLPSSISGKKIDVARATRRSSSLASDSSEARCQCQNRKPRGALTKGYSPLAYTMCHCFSPPSSSILQKLFELKYDEHVLNNEYYQQQQSVCSSPSL